MRREGEFWVFFLADQLKMEPAAVRDLPAHDYVGLVNWYEIKGIMTDLSVRTEMART